MSTINNLLKIMDELLAPDGCPWDREQTHESLRPYMIEECQEAVEAIDGGNMCALKDELGDVLLQVVFHAKIAEKAGNFTFDDVVNAICHKLTSRHSHIFGDDKAETAEEVAELWARNKKLENRKT